MTRGLIVGTGGHVDHGKTSLVRALTGVETDRWVEERERGLTIDIGFAPLESVMGGDAGIVDVPGHEDFVKNMLAGSTGVDVLLLVVAADEGPMPQTREHVTIARLLGIRSGVVAMNKIDRVDDEWLALVREETRGELTRLLGHSEWPIVDVSAATGQGLADLRKAIRAASKETGPRDSSDLFRMPIDRSFSVRGAGTVVTGTTWSGTVRVGETLGIQPGDMTARVRSLQVHGSERDEVGPGIRCAMALVGVDAARIDRGSVVLGPGNWRPSSRLGVRLEVPPGSVREVDHGQRVRLFLGTSEVMARVRTVKRDAVSAGGLGWAVLDCEQPVVARVRDRFVLRFYSPVTTVGGGQVCALDPPRGWRAQLDLWSAILDGSPEDSVVAAVSLAGGEGMQTDDAPLVTGVASGMGDELLSGSSAVTRVGGAWYGRTSVDAAAAAVLAHLRNAHALRRRSSAESLEALRAGLSVRFSADLVEFVVGELALAGKVVVEGPGIRLRGHEPGLSDSEAQALRDLEAVLVAADLAPPAPAQLATAIGVDRELLNDLLKLLVERDLAVRVTPEMILMRSAELRARETIRRLASSAPVSPGEFRQALGLSRKHLIPLLEYMDREGVTRRTPEGRILKDG